MNSVLQAIHEQGVEGDVTSVDCTEYPCIAYGEVAVDALPPSEDPVNALLATRALASYAGDARTSTVSFILSSDDSEGSKPKVRFALSLYPEADKTARGAQIEKRLRFRFGQMLGLPR